MSRLLRALEWVAQALWWTLLGAIAGVVGIVLKVLLS
jgi:hypothetical protein